MRVDGIGARVLGRQKGCVSAWGICEHVCAGKPGDIMCFCTMDLLSLRLQEEETLLSAVVFHMSPVCRYC